MALHCPMTYSDKIEVNMKEIELRSATLSDLDLVFQWANDTETRKNSFQTTKIPYEEHKKWYQSRLKSKASDIFICYKNEIPVGQIRLDYQEKQAYISYSVAKEERGKGYGTALLSLIEEKAKNDIKRVSILCAKVKKDNIASCKKFEKLGYEKGMEQGYILYSKRI